MSTKHSRTPAKTSTDKTDQTDPYDYDQLDDTYGADGYDAEGYNRNGFDRDGYDAKGFTNSGYDADGYDRQGYDRRGLDRDGDPRPDDGKIHVGATTDTPATPGGKPDRFDRQGYDRDGYDENGYDRQGYDRDGLDEDGIDRDGYRLHVESEVDQKHPHDYDQPDVETALPMAEPGHDAGAEQTDAPSVVIDRSIEADDPYAVDGPKVDLPTAPVSAPTVPTTKVLDPTDIDPKPVTDVSATGAGDGGFGSGAPVPGFPMDPDITLRVDDIDTGHKDLGAIEHDEPFLEFDDPTRTSADLSDDTATLNWFDKHTFEASATDPTGTPPDDGNSFDLDDA